MSKLLGGCVKFAKDFDLDFSCCDQCHDDDWNGVNDMLHHETSDGYYVVCCKAKEALENKSDTHNMHAMRQREHTNTLSV